VSKGSSSGTIDPRILAAKSMAEHAAFAGTTLQLGRAEDPPRTVGPSAWATAWALARAMCLSCTASGPPEMWESMGVRSWWHDRGQTACAARIVWRTVRDL